MSGVSDLREHLSKLSVSDQEFAQSLIHQAATRGLSPKQNVWVDKLVTRAKAPPRNAVQVNVMPLVDFLADANLKRPAMLLQAGDRNIRLSIAGPGSRAPGYVVVTSPERSFSERTFFGRISPEGRFEPALILEEGAMTAIVAALQAMAADPAGTAAKFGKVQGQCCFCSIPLTDERSLHVGYGKICARKFNLPYGTTA